MAGETNPAKNHVAVVKSDVTTYTPAFDGLYVGTTGDVSIITKPGGTAVVYKAVPGGTFMPVNAHIVRATGTTAADIVGLLSEAF